MEPRVILVDADEAERAAAVAVLESAGIDVVAQAASGEAALDLVATAVPNVALIDVSLPGIGPVITARRMRDLTDVRVETVAMASFTDLVRLGEMVAAGAAAYVLKGRPDEIVAATRAVAAGSGLLSAEASRPVLEDMNRLYERERSRNDELETMIQQLEALSVTDWLTGLKNHGYFYERLNEELERARRYDRPLGVLMADLDDFKRVNDAFGHNAGNSVLRAIGEVLRTQLREVDVACRVGGEEFGLIMPETGADGAMQAAERIRRATATRKVPGVPPVTISLGVAVFPDHAQNRSDLLEAADRALYLAKRDGKDQCVLAAGATPSSATQSPGPGPVAETLLRLLDMKAPELADYAREVSDLAVRLAEQLDFPVGDVEKVRIAGLLHDVGMLTVPDYVLTRPGPLPSADWDLVRRHSRHGSELIGSSVHPDVALAVLSHHERFDGSGYPQQLRGEAIPVLARVLSVADAFLAMTNDRPYREARSEDDALRELRHNAGTQFDPAAVDALWDLLRNPEAMEGTVVAFPRSEAG